MKYAIGIDLGTTNTELAYCLLDDTDAKPQSLPIPQFVATSTVESRTQLPSFLYIGPEEERSLAEWKLPWDSIASELETSKEQDNADVKSTFNSTKKPGFFKRLFKGRDGDGGRKSPVGTTNPNALYLSGQIAYLRASESPEMVVASAKSWLTNSKVDRHAPILPWNVPKSIGKVSPVEASRVYLTHLVSAWNNAFPDSPIFEQQVVITVPASFDESARELTYEAAIAAGFNPETLLFLEEPQAALYSWLAQKGDDWRKELKVNDVIFVCDVGGGTTDLSLIRVEAEDGNLILNRLAVGKRLLLGGDNIDLALAYRATEFFAQQGKKLDPWQSGSLQFQCRNAKERLLVSQSGYADDNYRITVLGRSSQLIGDSISIDFPKQDAISIVLNGFFPQCSLADAPQVPRGIGVREIGLPYESDPAITRHIAKFLYNCVDETGAKIYPTCFILNGGVFKSELLVNRLRDQLSEWFPEKAPRNIHPNADLDHAVSHGAAYYAVLKNRGGVRIRAASAQSYYIGVESSGLAIPGISRPLKALCVAPQGMEEGSECSVSATQFELVVGEPVVFRFFSCSSRPFDEPGAMLDWYENDNNQELTEIAPIETMLWEDPAAETNSQTTNKESEPEYVSIRFRSVVTELGFLEIWCEEISGPRRWKLEFSVRDE